MFSRTMVLNFLEHMKIAEGDKKGRRGHRIQLESSRYFEKSLSR